MNHIQGSWQSFLAPSSFQPVLHARVQRCGFETQNLCVSVLFLTTVSCEDRGELGGVLSGQWLSLCFPEGRAPDLPRGGWVRWPGALLPAQVPALTSHRAGGLWPPRVFLGIFLAAGGGALAGARVSVNPRIVCFRGGCVPVGPDRAAHHRLVPPVPAQGGFPWHPSPHSQGKCPFFCPSGARHEGPWL